METTMYIVLIINSDGNPEMVKSTNDKEEAHAIGKMFDRENQRPMVQEIILEVPAI